MSSTKPAVLIVSGAWHFPSHYAKLADALQALGFVVHVPQLLTANGARPPTADLYADCEFVRGLVTELADKGQEVIVIAHSYGGMVSTNAFHDLGLRERAAEGKTGGISHLVFLAAAAYKEGMTTQSMVAKATESSADNLLAASLHVNEDGTIECKNPREVMFGPDFHGPEIEEYCTSMGITNVQIMVQSVQHTCAWRNIPVTYIQATQDLAMPSVFQEFLINDMEKEGVKVNVHKISGPHCLNFTHASEIAEVVSSLSNV